MEKNDASDSPAAGRAAEGTGLTAEYGRPIATARARMDSAPPFPPDAAAAAPPHPAPHTASHPAPHPKAHKAPALSLAEQLDIRADMSRARLRSETLKINVHQQRAELERIALRIPDFASFRKLVIDDLRDAWDYDRMHNMRTVSNQVEHWKRLYPCWARRVKEHCVVKIYSLGHSGAYECELAEPPMPDVWEVFFNAGVAAGASWAVLNDVYRQFKDAPAKTIRAGKKSAAMGRTAPPVVKPPS